MCARNVMLRVFPNPGILIGPALLILSSGLCAQESIESLKKAMVEQLDTASTETVFKKAELAKKYVGALDALEKTLTASGKLDQILHLREERTMVQKSGETTAHQDKELAELRDKYVKGLAAIDSGLTQAQAKVAADIAAKGKAGEAALTRAGKIEEALAYRKNLQQLLLEAGGPASSAVPFREDPRTAASPGLAQLEDIKLPTETPPLDNNAFANPDSWLESLTVPAAKQKLKKSIHLGDRGKKKWPLICVSPGSHWQGDDGIMVGISAARFAATRSRFEKVVFDGELDTYAYFMNCYLDECRIQRGGVWWGWDMGAKFYFDNCLIKDSFTKGWDIVGYSIRIQKSVLTGIEFPTFYFGKKQPAEFINHKWLRIVNCRFVKCTLPVNVLLMTRDCIFEDCTFVDNDSSKPNQAPITSAIETVLYTDRCRTRISALPAALKLTEKPVNSLKGADIPTLSSLESLLGK